MDRALKLISTTLMACNLRNMGEDPASSVPVRMMGRGRGEVLLHLKMADPFLAALDRGGTHEYIADHFENRLLSE